MPQLFRKIFSLSTLALITALTLSVIAAWYSVVGLTAIFAAAMIPIIIMGGSLEIAKVVTTVWLHRYWDQCGKIMKTYLTGAVVVLALVTSMGIFGFLSKAHMDQGIPTGDVAAQISLIDEKINIQKELIKSERENIESARRALAQLDAQVSARLDRGTSEASAERSVQIRAAQRRDRQAYTKEIEDAQTRIEKSNGTIQQLSIEKAPLASQYRKIEAEVGPIKYIAALIYGDNPDNATLERAVRWVIILLIFVFDPLALMLVIAAISSYKWEFERKEEVAFTGSTGYLPLTESEREGRPTPLPEIEEPKAGDTELTADGGVKNEEQVSPVKKKLKEFLNLSLNKLRSLRSPRSEQTDQQSEPNQKQEENLESNQNQSYKKFILNLKEKFKLKNLTDWKKSPTLKLLNRLLPTKR
jgi:hypothetical protein